MTIELPEELSQFVKEQMARFHYSDVNDYFRSLLEERQRRDLREELELSLLEADAEPSTPMKKQDWDDIRRRGTAEIERRKKRA